MPGWLHARLTRSEINIVNSIGAYFATLSRKRYRHYATALGTRTPTVYRCLVGSISHLAELRPD